LIFYNIYYVVNVERENTLMI